jgi:pyruvate/2-oxoglutarate dehydrogenase complex dihydrolipoamide dehydrogenase (E3) component
MKHYDAIILGSGQAGNPLARYLASRDLKVALVEKGEVGGTCVNVGCTPTKTLVASAKVAYFARRAEDFGVITGPVSIDMEKVMDRTLDIVLRSRTSNEKSFETNPKIDLIRGKAGFMGPREIRVSLNSGGEVKISADRIYINTGGHPTIPPMEGLDQVPYYTSDTIFGIRKVPEHLVLIGAGYISLEFAQIFKRLGSKVTVLSQGSEFLPREDKDISKILLKILRDEGIEILFGISAQKIYQRENGLGIEILKEGKLIEILASELFLGVGRTPNSDLNLPLAGVELDKRGFIKTNEYLETTAPNIYALGDIKGGPAFTHISYDDFRIIRDNFESPHKRSIKDRLTNYTLFTDPELARIGLNELEARELKIEYRLAYLPMTYVARAIEMGETGGMMKVLVDKEGKNILGATILAIEGGEIAATLQVAMEGELQVKDLHNFIFSHPTLMESLNNLFAQTQLPKENFD